MLPICRLRSLTAIGTDCPSFDSPHDRGASLSLRTGAASDAELKYLPIYLVFVGIAVVTVFIVRYNITTSADKIAGYPICTDTSSGATLDLINRPQVQMNTHPRCWSGWISFSQSNLSWHVEHGTRPLEFFYQNGGRETGATTGEGYTLKKYPGGAIRLRGGEGVTVIAIRDPHSPTKSADSRGAQWEKLPNSSPQPLPPPAKLEPLPAPPPPPRGATYQPLPTEQPKREQGATYQPLPPEQPRKESGAASFQQLPSSPSPQRH